ncbi:response regulator, partial [bacterium]|nr:response regulator [bacterium]
YREFFMRAPDAFLIIENETFVDCNPAAVAMLRCDSREQLLRTHPSELSPPFQSDGRESREKAGEMMRLALKRGSHRFEWDHRRADGSVFPVEVSLTAVPREDGVTVLHTTWRDLSSRRQLELELRQAQKMEAVGRLTGGIAHDFNNLLASILGNCELMDMDLAAEHPARESLAEIKSAGDRAADLVSQLLAFSRKQILRTTVFDLSDVLRRSVAMLRHLLGEDMEAQVTAWSRPLHVRADASQLQQVLLNLVANARDASEPDGLIRIETALTVLKGSEIPPGSALTPGPHAMLRVADDGAGIDPALLCKVFEPFYTTKQHGTGLGLATSHGIVRQCGGDLHLDSRPGLGTTATVYLPLTDELIDQPSPARAPARCGCGETILLVEDEPSVALLAERVLQQAGYTVVTAGNGQRALEQVLALELEFDLLLTDVIMPAMGGPELAERLRAIRPDLKVLFCSGYTDDALTQRGVLQGGVDLLRKPYGVEELKRRVREALDAG